MEIKKIKLNDIIPYENNVKEHPQEQIEQLKNSILEFGNNDPIAIDEFNIIIEGHGRYMALQELGYEEAECIILSGLSEEQKNAYRIVHNQLTMNTGFDMDALKIELQKINLDMTELGLSEDMLDDVFDKDAEDDNFDLEEALEEIEEPVSKYGEIYKLGNHYLMCGDSTKEQDVLKLMQGNKADLLITDPPYNVNVENSQGMTIENDNMSKDDFKIFISAAMKNASKILKEGGAFYIWYGDVEDIAFRTACFNNDLSIRQCLIWVKNGLIMGRQDYHWKHEPCLYGWKEGAAHYFIDDRTQSTIFEDKPDLNSMTKEQLKELAKKLLEDRTSTTIMHEDKPLKNTDHPTMKPIKLLARQIKNSSKRNEIVVDLFGGSGSTLITCEELDRTCYMMEYDPKYVDVIIKRWETLTGGKAELWNKQ